MQPDVFIYVSTSSRTVLLEAIRLALAAGRGELNCDECNEGHVLPFPGADDPHRSVAH